MQTLKERREQLGLTQAQLAHKAGVVERTVRLAEQGKRSPNLRTARAIAEALGVSVDDLGLAETSSV